jgi:hypothetical protein
MINMAELPKERLYLPMKKSKILNYLNIYFIFDILYVF